MMNSHLIDSDGSPGQRTLTSVDLRNNLYTHTDLYVVTYTHA